MPTGRGSQPTQPAVVTLHIWGVPTSAVPRALLRMALDRPLLRRQPASFTKLLGTSAGRSFSPRDADPRHWAVVCSWPTEREALEFEHSPTARGWDRIADERLSVALRPLASRGRWSRRLPFGEPVPVPVAGPVASITRARIRPTKAATFRRAVPAVATDLRSVDGLRLAVGIGEAPVGLQGTFSIWQDSAALTDFAHRRNPHRDAIRLTDQEDWYAEELFARFQVLSVDGTYGGRTP